MQSDVINLVLIGLLILQQLFYSYTIHRLINKIMSRNYAELVQAERQQAVSKTQGEVDINIEPDEQSKRQAQELNTLFGIV